MTSCCMNFAIIIQWIYFTIWKKIKINHHHYNTILSLYNIKTLQEKFAKKSNISWIWKIIYGHKLPHMKKTRKKKQVCGAGCFMAAEIKFSKDVRPSVCRQGFQELFEKNYWLNSFNTWHLPLWGESLRRVWLWWFCLIEYVHNGPFNKPASFGIPGLIFQARVIKFGTEVGLNMLINISFWRFFFLHFATLHTSSLFLWFWFRAFLFWAATLHTSPLFLWFWFRPFCSRQLRGLPSSDGYFSNIDSNWQAQTC